MTVVQPAPHTPPPRWQRRRAAIAIVLALVALPVVLLLALYFMDWNSMRGPVSAYLSHRAGREIHINGDLSVDLFRLQPRVDARDVEVSNPGWMADTSTSAGTPAGTPAGRFDDIKLEFRLFPLLLGKLVLPLVQLEKPQVFLVRQESGRTNWDSDSPGDGAWKLPPIQHFAIHDGQVRIEDNVRDLTFTGTVNSHEDGGRGAAFVLTGKGTLNKNAFGADINCDPLLHVNADKSYGFTADIRAGKTHARIRGAIDHPFQLDRYHADLTLSGDNLADVYYLTGLTLPGTPPYQLNVTVRRDGQVYRLTDLHGVMGKSDLAGNLSIDVSDKVPVLAGRLASRHLNFADLGALFGGGPQQAVADGHLLPDTVLHTERLRQTNAEIDYSAAKVDSRDFPLTSLGVHVSLENGVLVLKPLSFGMTQGRLGGSLKIDARHDIPVTSLDGQISGVAIANFIKGADKPLHGALSARAQLTGRGRSVHQTAASANGKFTAVIPQGQIRRSLAEWMGVNVISALGLNLSGDESNSAVRCAVAQFDAKNGVLTARRLVFDTEPVLVEGGGTVDMNHETMDLRVQGKPKHFQLLRVRAPVTVTGRWDAPKLGVEPGQALGQGGIAAALGFLNPLASVLAFVDPGLAKDANCAPMIQQARAGKLPAKSQPKKN
ncbi:MAG: AsmA family protein [Alphaproteobacteria bacterium]|nr:AsmA family protein [Alphaproteobacteria bacterium]